jgi:hypothetical protein
MKIRERQRVKIPEGGGGEEVMRKCKKCGGKKFFISPLGLEICEKCFWATGYIQIEDVNKNKIAMAYLKLKEKT